MEPPETIGGGGRYYRAGDLIRDVRTGEAIEVTCTSARSFAISGDEDGNMHVYASEGDAPMQEVFGAEAARIAGVFGIPILETVGLNPGIHQRAEIETARRELHEEFHRLCCENTSGHESS